MSVGTPQSRAYALFNTALFSDVVEGLAQGDGIAPSSRKGNRGCRENRVSPSAVGASRRKTRAAVPSRDTRRAVGLTARPKLLFRVFVALGSAFFLLSFALLRSQQMH